MTNKLSVEFLGLTSVVTERDAGGKIESCMAVLPDLKDGLFHKRLPGAKDKRCTPSHVAAVLVPSDCVNNQSGKTAAMKFQAAKGQFSYKSYSLYLLAQESLSFSGLVQTPLQVHERPVDPDNSNTHTPNSEADRQGVQWIPRLELANHGNRRRNAGKFRRNRFLNADSTPKNRDGKLQLAGTVPISTGRFYVDDVVSSEGERDAFDIYVPKRPKEKWQQSIYSRIFWENSFEGDRLDIIFTRQNGDRGTVTIGTEHGQCDVVVANLELDGLLGVDRGEWKDSAADFDFAISYLFCKKVPKKKHGCPVPHGVTWIRGGSSPRCKSAKLEG